jgi:hypothetical protein
MCEAIVSIASGMLLWLGFWDALEIVLPPEWYWRLAMIGVGIVGLFATRTMYDKSMLARVRSRRTECASASMLSGMEMANGGDAASNDTAAGHGAGASSTRAVGASPGADGEASAPAGDGGAPAPAPAATRQARPFFDAPRPDARRCCRAVFAILVGLTLWVGLWDLVDYTLLPALFHGRDGSSVCEAAEADPGPRQLVRAPACLAIKLMLMICGVTGLWGTRALYGTVQVHSSQFARFE